MNRIIRDQVARAAMRAALVLGAAALAAGCAMDATEAASVAPAEALTAQRAVGWKIAKVEKRTIDGLRVLVALDAHGVEVGTLTLTERSGTFIVEQTVKLHEGWGRSVRIYDSVTRERHETYETPRGRHTWKGRDSQPASNRAGDKVTDPTTAGLVTLFNDAYSQFQPLLKTPQYAMWFNGPRYGEVSEEQVSRQDWWCTVCRLATALACEIACPECGPICVIVSETLCELGPCSS